MHWHRLTISEAKNLKKPYEMDLSEIDFGVVWVNQRIGQNEE